MVGAKVDGRIVPLDYKVKTGEIVEIITTGAQGQGPQPRLAEHCATPARPRNKIRTWFKKERKEENIAAGQGRSWRRSCAATSSPCPEEKYEEFMADLAQPPAPEHAGRAVRRHRLRRHAALPPDAHRSRTNTTKLAQGREALPRCFRSAIQKAANPAERRHRRRDWTTAWSNSPSAATRCRATISSALSPAGFGVSIHKQLVFQRAGRPSGRRRAPLGERPLGGKREGELQILA